MAAPGAKWPAEEMQKAKLFGQIRRRKCWANAATMKPDAKEEIAGFHFNIGSISISMPKKGGAASRFAPVSTLIIQ
jgi:hypothetical protein